VDGREVQEDYERVCEWPVRQSRCLLPEVQIMGRKRQGSWRVFPINADAGGAFYRLNKYDPAMVQDEPTLAPVPDYDPYHIGVYAHSTTDLGGALRIIAQVDGAVLVDASRVDPTYYKEIIQVGGPKDDKATIHLSGENRAETDAAVTAWLQENET